MKGLWELALVLIALVVITTTVVYIQGASVREIAKMYWLTLSLQMRDAVSFANELNRKARERKEAKK